MKVFESLRTICKHIWEFEFVFINMRENTHPCKLAGALAQTSHSWPRDPVNVKMYEHYSGCLLSPWLHIIYYL